MSRSTLRSYSSEQLISELDRRLKEEGVCGGAAGMTVEKVVGFLQDDWVLIALPRNLANDVTFAPATEETVVSLSNELRAKLVAEDEKLGDLLDAVREHWRVKYAGKPIETPIDKTDRALYEVSHRLRKERGED